MKEDGDPITNVIKCLLHKCDNPRAFLHLSKFCEPCLYNTIKRISGFSLAINVSYDDVAAVIGLGRDAAVSKHSYTIWYYYDRIREDQERLARMERAAFEKRGFDKDQYK